MGLEYTAPRNPLLWVKYVLVSLTICGEKRGRGSGVSVGKSGIREVSVGVTVIGVAVSVAKRSWVGIRVTVGRGVGVSTGAGAVGEAIKFARFGIPPEQLEKISPNRINGIIFFMRIPLWFKG